MNVSQNVQGTGNIFSGTGPVFVINQPPPLPPQEVTTRQNLQVLLNKVKTFWIEGVLERSVHAAALIDLGKQFEAKAVEHPWEMVLTLPDETNQKLEPHTSLIDIFEQMNRTLLILGAPGSGKTTSLLDLARGLITRAESEADFSQPIPVVFNLSTWTDQRQPLQDWITAELASKYQIPRRISRPWLENYRVLPLLDGLDEVRPESRTACVQAINTYGESFGLTGLVVCSRLQEYISLPVRLKLGGAISLQPLTLDEVDRYLVTAGSKLSALRDALQTDAELQNLARTPLMLNVMTLTYSDSPNNLFSDQTIGGVEERRERLFDTYIERMFKRKGQAKQPYSSEQAKRWLTWLAQGMIQHNQTIFMIEQLQPSWLSSRRQRWIYALSSRLMGGLIIGPALFLPGLFAGGLAAKTIIDMWVESGIAMDEALIGFTRVFFVLIFGLIAALIVAPSVGLSVGLIDALRFERDRAKADRKKFSALWYFLLVMLLSGLMIWLSGGLAGTLLMLLLVPDGGLIAPLILGFLFGLILALSAGLNTLLLFGFVFGRRGAGRGIANDIQTVESLRLSWNQALKSAVGGAFFGLLLNILLLPDQVSALVAMTLSGAIASGLHGLISGKVVEGKTAPNRGVWLSARNAVILGPIFGIVTGLVVGFFLGIVEGLSSGLYFGLIAALGYGGLDFIQHYTLRPILGLRGQAPRNLDHFLDYAAERVFLQKVGGGYTFIHRLLMEHFAKLETEHRPGIGVDPV